MGSRTVTERINIVATEGLESDWRYHYDLLVVPELSKETKGLSDGWVAPHSTIASYGGISIEELEVIRGIAGVETAAPLSIIGYSTVNGIDIEYIDAIPGSYYEIQHVQKVFDGLKTYEILNKTDLKRFAPSGTEQDSVSKQIASETGIDVNTPVIGTELKKPNELLIIAIDPVAENKLFTISESLEGSFRLEDTHFEEDSEFAGIPMIPVIKLATSGVKMEETISVASVHIPNDAVFSENLTSDLETYLKTPEMNVSFNSFQNRWNRNHVALNVEKDSTFKELAIAKFASSSIDVYHYDPIQFSNELSIKEDGIPIISTSPVEVDDFSKLSFYREKSDIAKKAFGIDVINYYHPKRIKPILNEKWTEEDPLDVYTPHHSAIIKDGAGNTLKPTPLLPLPFKNTYYTGAPDLITTIEAATYFYGSRPPISSVRIVVKDVAGRTAESQRIIEDVAAQIKEKTGHHVELMLGSTASKVQIDLGIEEVGSPGVVEEGWQQAGVSWSIQEEIEKSNLLLFGYLLMISIIFCYTLITHSLLRRSRDFALLRAMGWSRRNVLRALLLEVLILCVLALLPIFVVNSIIKMLPWLEICILISISVIVISLGYWMGSRKALRMSPRAGLEGEGIEWWFMRLFSINGLFTYILHQLMRRPARFGLMAIVIGLTSFMVVLFTATQKSLSDFLFLSFLGETIDLNLSGLQTTLLYVGIFLTVSTLFVLQYLNSIERRSEYSILRSIGWSTGRMQYYTGMEVLLVATVGSGIGGLCAYWLLISYSTIVMSIWFVILVLLAPIFLMLLFSVILVQVLKVSEMKSGQFTG